MTPEERVLVDYRLKRAREAIEEAGLLFDAGHLHTYVNRFTMRASTRCRHCS